MLKDKIKVRDTGTEIEIAPSDIQRPRKIGELRHLHGRPIIVVHTHAGDVSMDYDDWPAVEVP